MKELIDEKHFDKMNEDSCADDNKKTYLELMKMARILNRLQESEEAAVAEKEEEEPLGCPWCGGECHAEEWAIGRWDVECKNKNCLVKPEIQGGLATKQEAINAWNSRR